MKLDNKKILEEIKDLELDIRFLFELSKKVENFKLKPGLSPRECLFESSALIREGKEEEARDFLLNCRNGIEATLTMYLRKSWIYFESRLNLLMKNKLETSAGKKILAEVVRVLDEEKHCVKVIGPLDLEIAVELYGEAFCVLRYAFRELHTSASEDDSFIEKWKRLAVADGLCQSAEMFPS